MSKEPTKSQREKEERQLAYIYLSEMHRAVNSSDMPEGWQYWGVINAGRFKYVVSRIFHLCELQMPRTKDIFETFDEFVSIWSGRVIEKQTNDLGVQEPLPLFARVA